MSDEKQAKHIRANNDDLLNKTFAVGKKFMVEFEVKDFKQAMEWVSHILGDKKNDLIVGCTPLRLDIIDTATESKNLIREISDVVEHYKYNFGHFINDPQWVRPERKLNNGS